MLRVKPGFPGTPTEYKILNGVNEANYPTLEELRDHLRKCNELQKLNFGVSGSNFREFVLYMIKRSFISVNKDGRLSLTETGEQRLQDFVESGINDPEKLQQYANIYCRAF